MHGLDGWPGVPGPTVIVARVVLDLLEGVPRRDIEAIQRVLVVALIAVDGAYTARLIPRLGGEKALSTAGAPVAAAAATTAPNRCGPAFCGVVGRTIGTGGPGLPVGPTLRQRKPL